MTASAGSVRSRTRPRRLGCATVLVGAGAVAALTRAVVCAGTPTAPGLSSGAAVGGLAGAVGARDPVARTPHHAPEAARTTVAPIPSVSSDERAARLAGDWLVRGGSVRASPPDWRASGRGGRTPVRTMGTR